PIFHSRFVEYARVRGFAIFAAQPRRPTDKPFVERGIGFLRTRFLPGRRFASLQQLAREATAWRDTFANAREHEQTGKVPALVFEHEERQTLAPLRTQTFDTDELLPTSVGRTHRVHFDRNDYTVPWRLVGQSVLVRADDELVRVMLGPKEVARHVRSWSVREDVEKRTTRMVCGLSATRITLGRCRTHCHPWAIPACATLLYSQLLAAQSAQSKYDS
ncbi:MAG TPA: integrase core domain-containing protein, partial [Polyangiaceae bacterium]|nr:integrase core domain-containing protein [Polyangiaceae bacterium]